MLTLLRLLLAAYVCVVCAAPAFADGGAFKPLVEGPSAANMPDQRAILAYSNGTETLAIQTRFEGNPAEFAWVVPLPAVPKVSPCTHGTFKTMPSLMARRVHGHEPSAWVGAVFLALGLSILFHCRSRFVTAAGFLVFMLGGAVLTLPMLGNARGTNAAPAEPSLKVQTEEVGSYEVNILSSQSADELTGWLKDHGFAVSDQARAAIAAYARDGWVFAASRASRAKLAAGGGTITPHALTFEFQTPVPIYPMRLTGANNTGPLKVSLYVFGAGTASAEGWTLKHSDVCEIPPTEPDPVLRRGYPTSKVLVTHAGLRAVLATHAGSPLHATHLTRTFTPSEMAEDVVLHFGAPIQYQEHVWSPSAAFDSAANWGGAAMVAFWLIAIGLRDVFPGVRAARVWAVCAGAPVLLTLAIYAATPRSDSLKPSRHSTSLASDLYWEARKYASNPSVGPKVATSTDEMSQLDAQKLVESWVDVICERPWRDSERPGTDDSPGNYLLERDGSHWIIRVFDLLGQESRIPI